MNFKFLLTLAFFFIAKLAVAQRFTAGILAGIAATQISGDNLGGFDKPGFVGGGMVKTDLSPKFDMAMEILYFQKGSRKNANPEKGDYDSYLLRLNYFEVPVLVQWKYSKRFTFETGPTFGALLSVKEEDALGEIQWSPPRPFDNFELGIAGGMKINFATSLAATFRIESSVLPVRPHQSGESSGLNHGQYNAAVLLNLQYTFKKKNESH